MATVTERVARAMWASGPDAGVDWDDLDEPLRAEIMAMAQAGMDEYNKAAHESMMRGLPESIINGSET